MSEPAVDPSVAADAAPAGPVRDTGGGPEAHREGHGGPGTAALVIGAIGVVFGDIGTSP